nr:FecR domain-containing protein [uncultured Draconibacterium sp.]
MERKYANYNAIQFASDPYFLQWQMSGDDESNTFWESYRKKHPEKEKDIQDAIRIVKSIRINDVRFTEEELKQERLKIISRAEPKIKLKRNRFIVAATAAACFLLLVISYLFLGKDPKPVLLSEEQQAYPPIESKDIVLSISGDSIVTFDENTDVKIDKRGSLIVSESNQKALFSHEADPLKNEADPVMNKLVVPRGKRSSLVLADGSKIWINSGSTLEFPSGFITNQRLIKVEGEIFIEVAKNDTKPFTVRTEKFDVIVTGTTFNVTAYNDETTQRVVLVEGSVKIDVENKPTMNLEPNDKFSLTGDQAEKQKVDVYDYISWKDGIYRFAGDSLENVLKRLSRYYDVNFVCDDDVKNMQLRGKLALMEDFTSVLDNIEVIVPIKYEIEKDKILIRKK